MPIGIRGTVLKVPTSQLIEWLAAMQPATLFKMALRDGSQVPSSQIQRLALAAHCFYVIKGLERVPA